MLCILLKNHYLVVHLLSICVNAIKLLEIVSFHPIYFKHFECDANANLSFFQNRNKSLRAGLYLVCNNKNNQPTYLNGLYLDAVIVFCCNFKQDW